MIIIILRTEVEKLDIWLKFPNVEIVNEHPLFSSHFLALPGCLSLLVITLFNSLFSMEDIEARLAPNFLNSIDES